MCDGLCMCDQHVTSGPAPCHNAVSVVLCKWCHLSVVSSVMFLAYTFDFKHLDNSYTTLSLINNPFCNTLSLSIMKMAIIYCEQHRDTPVAHLTPYYYFPPTPPLQLRGEGGMRQVEGAACALQQNMGLGSAAVVTLYGKSGRPQSARL